LFKGWEGSSMLFRLWNFLILNLQKKINFLQDIGLVSGIKLLEQIYQLGKTFVRMLPKHFSLSVFEPIFIYIERRTNQFNEPIVDFSFLYLDPCKVSARQGYNPGKLNLGKP
jgi:hypothetical protein